MAGRQLRAYALYAEPRCSELARVRPAPYKAQQSSEGLDFPEGISSPSILRITLNKLMLPRLHILD